MKIAIVVLAVALAVLGILYFQQGQTAHQQLEALLVTSNKLVAAESEVAGVRSQMVAQGTQTEQKLAALGAEKGDVEERLKQVQQRIQTLQQDLDDEKTKVSSVETQRDKLQSQLGSVSNELVSVRAKLSEAERSQKATEAELDALRQRQAALELEKASLERQLNDLDSLKAQIRAVKRRLWEQRIAEWKRQDEEAAAKGNNGMLLRNGEWQTVGPTVKPPS